MTIQDLITQVRTQPQSVEFSQVINTIQQHYQYTATGFSNGEIVNEKGSNEGSCKILYFAHLNQLTESETLHSALFIETTYYNILTPVTMAIFETLCKLDGKESSLIRRH